MQKPIIGVMGGSKVDEGVYETARQLGRLIAEQGWILLNGGRNTGVMAASAEGAKEGGGLVVGILPDKTTKRASPHVDIPILTGMGDGRNLINVMSSDVVVACKGALGTLSEVVLGLKCGKRVILLGWSPGQDLKRFERSGQLTTAKSPADAVDQVKEALSEMAE